ncbi:thioesterase family protein [Pseudomonas sp. RIT-PI-S]|uniref:acyl-CoA thioesterase n=1 Tax=Pseudomonas sp. RIT-PI-S TaxID=3035295 RepID=UPI0021D8FD9C|nr:thioesterase family protein [Pseudomonas sp. RIT-PI-S]
MEFRELLRALQVNPASVCIPPDWSQGRAAFGGLMAALLYEAMRLRLVGEGLADRPVRSLAISFVAPAALDTPTAFEVDVLRSGKSVVSLQARAIQHGEIVSLMQGSFGAARSSVVSLSSMPAPAIKPVPECFALEYIEGVTPQYLRHVPMRWGIGGLPFSGTPSPAIGGWVQLRGESQPSALNEAHLLALVDAWPPAVLPHLKAPAAGSTLTWTIEFMQPVPPLDGQAWYRYKAVIEHAADGYGHTSAALWSEGGQLLALSRQTVTVFG